MQAITSEANLKFDKIDLQIIKYLQKDARTHFTTIAKKLGLSTSAVQARFDKMKKSGLILGATVLVDRSRLGYYETIMGIKTVSPNTQEVVAYLKSLKIGRGCSVYCYEATISYYNLFLAIVHRDVLDLHLIKDMVLQHPRVIEVNANLITSCYKKGYSTLDLRNLIDRRV
jgi:DNA-binding Lrp family transcriptional regulator